MSKISLKGGEFVEEQKSKFPSFRIDFQYLKGTIGGEDEKLKE